MCSKLFSKSIDKIRNRMILKIFGIKFSFKINIKVKFPKNAISAQKILTTKNNINYNNKMATIFAMFNENGLITKNTLKYLLELKKYSDFLVVVSDCPMLKNEIEKFSNIVDAYIFERHNEYDFGSYKRGFLLLQDLSILENIDNLIFCNDSVLFNGNSLKAIVNKIKSKDFCGITINKNGYSKDNTWSIEPHVQSYFVSVSKNVFRKQFFIDFINSIKKEDNKIKIVYNYEQGLSRLIKENGYDLNSYYKIRDNDSKYPDPYSYYLNNDSEYEGERIFLKKNLITKF